MVKAKLGKILVDSEILRELEREFKCSRVWINLSINGHRDTDLSKRIRKRALDLGGSLKGTEKIKML